MRLIAYLFLVFILSAFCSADLSAQYLHKKWAIGAGVNFLDYQAPQGGKLFQPSNSDLGWYLSVDRYMTGAFSLGADFTYSQGVRFPSLSQEGLRPTLADLSYTLKFKFNNGAILRENAFFAPYLILGIGGSYVMGHPDLYVPLGGGVRFRVSPSVNLKAQVVSKQSINKDEQNLSHVIAFVYNLGTEKESEDFFEIPDSSNQQFFAFAPKDTDNDGVIDRHDNCPDEAGFTEHHGCPTEMALSMTTLSDFDQFPTDETLLAQNQAPLPKSGGFIDVDDFQEKNNKPVVVQAKPVQQNRPKQTRPIREPSFTDPMNEDLVTSSSPSDGDDRVSMAALMATLDEDKSITKTTKIPSPPSVQGEQVSAFSENSENGNASTVEEKINCNGLTNNNLPENSVLFIYGSHELSPKSLSLLDEMASMLQDCEKMSLNLKGHTDATGNTRDNKILSVMRAYNVKYYLVYNHGIKQSRISSSGFGESTPVAENVSSDGRQLNRRVDFELSF